MTTVSATHCCRNMTCSQLNRSTRHAFSDELVVALAIAHQRLPATMVFVTIGLQDQAPCGIAEIHAHEPAREPDLQLRLEAGDPGVKHDTAQARLEGIECPPVRRQRHPQAAGPAVTPAAFDPLRQLLRRQKSSSQGTVRDGEGFRKGHRRRAVEHRTQYRCDSAGGRRGRDRPVQHHAPLHAWTCSVRDGDMHLVRWRDQRQSPVVGRAGMGQNASGTGRGDVGFGKHGKDVDPATSSDHLARQQGRREPPRRRPGHHFRSARAAAVGAKDLHRVHTRSMQGLARRRDRSRVGDVDDETAELALWTAADVQSFVTMAGAPGGTGESGVVVAPNDATAVSRAWCSSGPRRSSGRRAGGSP